MNRLTQSLLESMYLEIKLNKCNPFVENSMEIDKENINEQNTPLNTIPPLFYQPLFFFRKILGPLLLGKFRKLHNSPFVNGDEWSLKYDVQTIQTMSIIFLLSRNK